MELAILENKPDFVDLLIENNIDLTGFLTERRLLFLFNSDKVLKLELKNYFQNFNLTKQTKLDSKTIT